MRYLYEPTKQKYIPNQIHINTRSKNDFGYIGLDTADNKHINKLQTDNYRTTKYTKNPCYYFPMQHKLYDLQNITEGQGGGMQPELDSILRIGHKVNLPEDRLQEKVTFIRYIDYLPRTRSIDHKRFLVSTSLSVDPQERFLPEFDIQGVNCRHYVRYSDEFFRDIVHKSNKYRKRAKVV